MPQTPKSMGADRTRSPAPAPIAFAGATLDRAAHLRDEAERLRVLDTSRAVLVGPGQDVSRTANGTLSRIPLSALPADAQLTFLGLDCAGAAMFAWDALAPDTPDAPDAPQAQGTRDAPRVPGAPDAPRAQGTRDGTGAPGTPDAPVAPAAEFVSLRDLMTDFDPADASLAAYAVGMVAWHRVHRHCGRCGHATDVHQAGHRRRCPNCGLVQFPRTDPAVTMLVHSGDRCLLSRRHGAPAHRWSALAGFLEPGETPEEAVVREAREETGVEVTGVEYLTSQPWPFPSALMIGFWAFADPDGAAAPEPQAGELVEARWWERGELAAALEAERIGIPPPGTIGNFLISTWLAAESGAGTS
jgi:NAD+ diphosphatase